jgi:hypothetical protein
VSYSSCCKNSTIKKGFLGDDGIAEIGDECQNHCGSRRAWNADLARDNSSCTFDKQLFYNKARYVSVLRGTGAGGFISASFLLQVVRLSVFTGPQKEIPN